MPLSPFKFLSACLITFYEKKNPRHVLPKDPSPPPSHLCIPLMRPGAPPVPSWFPMAVVIFHLSISGDESHFRSSEERWGASECAPTMALSPSWDASTSV